MVRSYHIPAFATHLPPSMRMGPPESPSQASKMPPPAQNIDAKTWPSQADGSLQDEELT